MKTKIDIKLRLNLILKEKIEEKIKKNIYITIRQLRTKFYIIKQ